mmetsp:Transcript_6769/g.25456  ORF Transcript_6769/g.25456 Transcript_6769/m.25456 type:complete len:252 (-) Transcript_6769:2-757(-)
MSGPPPAGDTEPADGPESSAASSSCRGWWGGQNATGEPAGRPRAPMACRSQAALYWLGMACSAMCKIWASNQEPCCSNSSNRLCASLKQARCLWRKDCTPCSNSGIESTVPGTAPGGPLLLPLREGDWLLGLLGLHSQPDTSPGEAVGRCGVGLYIFPSLSRTCSLSAIQCKTCFSDSSCISSERRRFSASAARSPMTTAAIGPCSPKWRHTAAAPSPHAAGPLRAAAGRRDAPRRAAAHREEGATAPAGA